MVPVFFHLPTKEKYTIPVQAPKNTGESAGAHGILNINQVDGAIVHPNVGQLVSNIYHDYLILYFIVTYCIMIDVFINICVYLGYC